MAVMASKAYKAGDVVFECKPIIHCINNYSKTKYCDNCLKRSDELKACIKCHQMYYCDQNCQQIDWIYHRKECRLFRDHHLALRMSLIEERLLLRLWLSFRYVPDFATKTYRLIDGTDISLKGIKINVTKLIEEINLKMFVVIFSKLVNIFGQRCDFKELLLLFGFVLSKDYLRPLYLVTDCPSKVNFDDLTLPIGFGIFIQIPNLSHSCVANVDTLSTGLNYVFRAIKSLESGEEFTRRRVDIKFVRERRHYNLSKVGLPVCQCDRCRLNLDKDIDYEEFNEMIRKNSDKLRLINDKHMRRHLKSIDFVIDFQLVMYLEEIYGYYCVPLTEHLILNYMFFALYSKHSNKTLIKLWYKEIESRVRVTHGSDHPTYRLLTNIFQNYI